jgi:hypothetical protein
LLMLLQQRSNVPLKRTKQLPTVQLVHIFNGYFRTHQIVIEQHRGATKESL